MIWEGCEDIVERALGLDGARAQIESVYDSICEYLDAQFSKHNYCNFIGDKCIANREDGGASTTRERMGNEMGCCHSFRHGAFMRIKDLQVCKHLKDKKCQTKCISCKLHTCGFLKEKGIRFDISSFPDIEKIFNRKQIDVLNLNPFNTKEDIIDRLVEAGKTRMPYHLFWLIGKGSID